MKNNFLIGFIALIFGTIIIVMVLPLITYAVEKNVEVVYNDDYYITFNDYSEVILFDGDEFTNWITYHNKQNNTFECDIETEDISPILLEKISIEWDASISAKQMLFTSTSEGGDMFMFYYNEGWNVLLDPVGDFDTEETWSFPLILHIYI